MSEYSHSLRKFADAGLQLRLPVDLVPATQYSRLTNGLPIIEGQLTTRDGLKLISEVFTIANVITLERVNTLTTDTTIAVSAYPNGYVVGQTVSIIVTGNDPDVPTNTVTLGTYAVTVVSLTSPTTFTFTPAIPTVWDPALTQANVFAQAYGSGPVQTLAQTAITNIYRLNQSVPSIFGDQLIAMTGRLYASPLITNPFSATLTGVTIVANNMTITLATPVPFAVGQSVAFSLVANATFLNGVTVIITNVAGNNFTAHFNHTNYTAADSGLVTAFLPPVFVELVHPTNAFEPPTTQNGFSGRPLSITTFRFTDDAASWAIIADQNVMYKYREQAGGGQPYFFLLGNPIPSLQAIATAGGAGNLNSTGGPGYDWRYTFYDGIVNTEGNPSPIMLTAGGAATNRPTAFTNPDPTFDEGNCINPGNCINGTDASISSMLGTVQDGPTITGQSCQWRAMANPAGTPTSLSLSIDYQILVTNTALGSCRIQVQYSLNNGTSWTFLINAGGAAVPRTTKTITLPAGTDLTQLLVRAQSIGQSWFISGHAGVATATLELFDIRVDSNTSAATLTLALTNQSANVCVENPVLAPNDGRVTGIRLYRRGGSLTDAWRLVGTFPLSGLVQGLCGPNYLLINDNVSDTTLSTSPILELDNDQPITSVSTTNQPLNYIWGPVGLEARVLGVGDPNRPEVVYFSKPGNADAWPPENFIEVSNPGTPMVAGCIYNNLTYAFSRERIYELIEGYIAGVTFTPFQTPSAHGLFTPWGLAVGPAMYFISKDGIYQTIGGQETSLVENDIKPLFPTYDTPGQDVHGYEAVDYTLPDNMRLRYHNDELYFLYTGRTTGTRQMLIYDILKKRWRAGEYAAGISEAYSQPATQSSLLLGTNAGSYYSTGGNFDPIELNVIESVIVQTVSTTSITLGAGNYYVRVSRFASAGEVALSNEAPNILVDASHSIQVTFPNAPAGTVKWRVYYGTASGQENQYAEFTEAAVAAQGRVIIIRSPGTAGNVPQLNADNNIAVVIRTGSNDQGVPLNRKQYGNVIFDLDPGGATIGAPVTITPYINGEAQANAAIIVTGTGRQQIPLDLTDYFAFNTEYEVAWERTDVGSGVVSNPVLYQYDTLFFIEPVGVKHWQSQPTSFGFPGFSHCRDAYIAIRSTGVVVLTITIDGAIVETYTIPSTGGQRLKQFIQFASNKGLLYQFSLDADTEFRVYEPDLEIRVKPWLGLLGYSVQRVIGGEVNT